MPSADTSVPPRVRSPRLVRLVLLLALGGGLAGLAAPATSMARPAADSEYHAAIVVAPALLELTPVRRTAHATRSRADSPLWVRPVAGPITSPFGPRWGGWHPGVDFGAGYGAPVQSVGAGTVIGGGYLPSEGGYGQIVLVRHAQGVITAYAHLSRVFVQAGQRVATGELLGLVGATGHVTGPHLHFEVRLDGAKVDPVPWLRAHGVRV